MKNADDNRLHTRTRLSLLRLSRARASERATVRLLFKRRAQVERCLSRRVLFLLVCTRLSASPSVSLSIPSSEHAARRGNDRVGDDDDDDGDDGDERWRGLSTRLPSIELAAAATAADVGRHIAAGRRRLAAVARHRRRLL